MANYYPHQAEDNRYRALDEGGQISDKLSAEQLAQLQQSQDYQNQENNSWGPNGENANGYRPVQQGQILGLEGGDDQWSLSDADKAAMRGDPYAQQQVTTNDLNNLNTDVTDQNASVRGTADAGARAVQGSVNPGAVDSQMQGSFAQAIDPSKLSLSDEFNSNYKFTPEDEQNMVTSAGQTVGNRYAALMDDATRRSLAAGESPAGVATARLRATNASNADADQAMLAAKIGAKQLGLNTTSNKEQMRLGAEGNLANTRIGAATTLGQTELQGQGLNLNAQSTASQMQQQAAKDAADRAVAAREFATGADTSAAQYADTNAANRAGQVATNQQNVNLTRSNQYKGIADNQQQQQQSYRDYLAGSKNTALQANATASGQQISNLGTKLGLANQSTQIAAGNNQPGLWSKLGSAALQFGGAALGAMA